MNITQEAILLSQAQDAAFEETTPSRLEQAREAAKARSAAARTNVQQFAQAQKAKSRARATARLQRQVDRRLKKLYVGK